MLDSKSSGHLIRATIAALALCLVVRIFLLQQISIIDPSEGRFAAAGVRMLTSGDLLTPEIPDRRGEWLVFWSKPVLHYWNTALSIYFFGTHNWVPRLPAFLSGLFILWLVHIFAKRTLGRETSVLAPLICFSSINFFAYSGAALSDMTNAACASAAFFCFWRHINSSLPKESKIWGIGFFLSLGFGVLTKGPVCVVMVGFGLAIWSILVRDWRWPLKLPWLTGLTAFCLTVVPWFYMAERKTPGFLYYFLFKENLGRFLAKDFDNMYGSTGHMYPHGFAWVMILAAFAPWSFFLLARFVFWCRSVAKNRSVFAATFSTLRSNRDFSFMLGWGLGPVTFLGLSQNLVPTYLLPAFGGLALVFCATSNLQAQSNKLHRICIKLSVALCLLITIGITIFSAEMNGTRSSEPLFRAVIDQAKPGQSFGVYNRYAFSGFFYLGVDSKLNVQAALEDKDLPGSDFDLFAFQKRDEDRLDKDFISRFEGRQELGAWVLYRKR